MTPYQSDYHCSQKRGRKVDIVDFLVLPDVRAPHTFLTYLHSLSALINVQEKYFFLLSVHSSDNPNSISAEDFGACNYTEFVAEAVGRCEKQFYTDLATDLAADCR